jgi:FkbM family methyltransferase
MILNLNHLINKYNIKVDGILHIGAHHGEEHIIYKNNNIHNIVYFEPLKSNFEILKNNVDDSIIYNIALGNDVTNIEMFVETQNAGQSSSILEPHLHLSQYPTIVFDRKEIVKMDKLDNIFPTLKSNFNMINIDVQGYELEVFKGAEKTLEHIDYIISEINRDDVYKNCAKINELQFFLSRFGFKLVEENWLGGIWGDGFFIKQ